MNGNKPIWCFVDGKVPIFIDKSEDAKFPILTNGRRYKKDSREWLHKTSNNRGKNRKRTGDSKSETMAESDTTVGQGLQAGVENLSDTMDTGLDSGGSPSPFNFLGTTLDKIENKNGHDIRLSPFQFFGKGEDSEVALNQTGVRSCMTRTESARRLRKRRLTWLRTEKNDNCCIEIAEETSQHSIHSDHPRFRPIAEDVELEEASQLLDPMAGRSHGDVNISHSLEISASFWFDTDDSNDGTWWREAKHSSSESSLEDFIPDLHEGDRPIDPTLIRSPVPKKREKLSRSPAEYDQEHPGMTGKSGEFFFQRIPSSPRSPPPDEADSGQEQS
ncbi:uncharacterized protein LOC117334075 [Pecten maximus]|uniref:uncharacterized protein LOC117334075 n=1 Tax=Pecten maximus TaxID=6579 RepID=UPI0014587A78|nr:uncharacterized protein LOC117334075 [Pecten maximus]